MANNYFLCYNLKLDDKIICISLGFSKPWIKGMEYYIDELVLIMSIKAKVMVRSSYY